ncbi:MAG: 3-deoxy-D-manno-octulosonic acid transferase [Desulfovibrionaceae bacterium]|nr:3-deoxy-D-manno-octulosonic acid transferase [Desulfovibrionaceae bacterium]
MNLLHHLLLGVYGGLWRAAVPFLRRNKRLAEGFAERLLPEGWPFVLRETDQKDEINEPQGSASLRLWIQAASGGEAWLVHSLVPALVRELEARAGQQGTDGLSPRLEVLCTTFTRQGLEVLEKLAASCAADTPALCLLPRYFPLDRPDLMRRAFALFPPQALILLETELWPGLLAAAREAHVPVLALNGRMTEKSLSAYRLLASFWRALAPRTVLAVSPEDVRRFSALFGTASQVRAMSNIKFDRVAEGLEQARLCLRGVVGCPERALLAVLASVREEEEDLLLPALKALQGLEVDGAPLMLAVAPRHMHRVAAWQEKLGAFGIPYLLRSAGRQPAPPVPPVSPVSEDAAGPLPLCLWDSFGELQALYAIADAVFVGGSLAPLGGQNFLEPLAQGIAPLVGPHVENFLWVGEEIFSSGLAVKLRGPEALAEALLFALGERRSLLPETGAPEEQWQAARSGAGGAVRERFAAWLVPRTGGSAQAARAVLDILVAKN